MTDCSSATSAVPSTATSTALVTSATVEKAGPLTLIQDSGRRGQQHLGVSVGGSLDRHAAGWANRLLGNSAAAAVLEIALGPFALRFASETRIALTGADCGWRLDGRPLPPWASHRVPAGGLLQGGMARTGLRAYLAIAGGILCPPVWGSRATTVGEKLGGLCGQALRAGDQLPYQAVDYLPQSWHQRGPKPASHQLPGGQNENPMLRRTPARFQRRYDEPLVLRLVPSNQFAQFPPSVTEQLFAQEYRVAADSDRMGVRLSGDALGAHGLTADTLAGEGQALPGNLVSEAVSPGAVQVPSSGLPIVLMRDCQTIGGYPKIGHVYSVDLDRLAQARPGSILRFVPGTLDESQSLLRQQRQFFLGVTHAR
ncbi:5-oxoprolinase subunit C [Microbulbifer aestuariivivens]|uniref:5-oxoprolinase subunit C n=1 Tax=Microbulbifer aestuariivivens TaxID=1908308 RepID=A0ABP9WP96_9GAMM